MHEASIAASLMRIAERALSTSTGTRLLRIDVSIGRLKAVEAALVQSCFAFMAEGTRCEGAELSVSEVAVRARCRRCAAEGEIQKYRFVCAACGSTELDVTGGQELRVDRVLVC